jgi:hypothetical protein
MSINKNLNINWNPVCKICKAKFCHEYTTEYIHEELLPAICKCNFDKCNNYAGFVDRLDGYIFFDPRVLEDYIAKQEDDLEGFRDMMISSSCGRKRR